VLYLKKPTLLNPLPLGGEDKGEGGRWAARFPYGCTKLNERMNGVWLTSMC
jgi:hypothetical protein